MAKGNKRRVGPFPTLIRAAAGLFGILALGAAAPDQAGGTQVAGTPAGGDQIKRGEYLTILGDCAACHTAENSTQKFSGGLLMQMPFGTLSTPNITPDKDTGIGNYTDDQFVRVFHEGVNAKGENLYPAMPYPWFSKVTRDDILAIKAYLFSLQPVHAPRQPSHISFPFNIRAGLSAWDAVFLKEGEFKPDPAKSEQVNRGSYIVNGLGHCGECHNGRNMLGATDLAQPLRGGPIQNWYAPNLTSDKETGIGKYSDDQLYQFLKVGVAQGMGVVAGPMAQTVHESTSKMTDDDVRAMVAYLKSVPAAESYKPVERSAYTGPQPAGREAYLSYCSSCHQLDGKGLGGAVPALAGNGAVIAQGPETVIRVILAGVPANAELSPMPAIGIGMTDQEIADVTNYIRQAWGNQAPPNAGPGVVGTLRPTTFTIMNGGPDGKCPSIVQPQLGPVINDPANGITEALKAMTVENVLQTAGKVVATVKAKAPGASRADIVNALTIAYCPIATQLPGVSRVQQVTMLDNFSTRVYSELDTSGKE